MQHIFFLLYKKNYLLLIIKVFILGSKRSAHSNAYFYGFFKSKRIVLYDTLFKDNNDTILNKTSDDNKSIVDGEDKDKKSFVDEVKDKKIDEQKVDEKTEEKGKGMSEEEILAILCHELGHWKLNHVLFNIVISQV